MAATAVVVVVWAWLACTGTFNDTESMSAASKPSFVKLLISEKEHVISEWWASLNILHEGVLPAVCWCLLCFSLPQTVTSLSNAHGFRDGAEIQSAVFCVACCLVETPSCVLLASYKKWKIWSGGSLCPVRPALVTKQISVIYL